MLTELPILIFVILGGFALLAILIKWWLSNLTQKQKPSEELVSWLQTTSSRLEEQNRTFTGLLQGNTKSLNERLDNAAKVIAQVQKNIGEMSEIGRGMKDLQDFLKSPKLRGNIGEQVLKELLGQMLPKQSFHLQYSFKSGVMVDAAIKTANGIVPIDSKFPMENFRRLNAAGSDEEKDEARRALGKDVKKHVQDIASKYILTDEGTIDYALMYIPSEAVYYEIVNDPELFEYAHKKCVLPVSPTTFYAYLKAILMSFEGQKIEQRAKQILTAIKAIQKDYLEIDASLGVLGKHLTNAYNQMNNVRSGFTLMGQKLSLTQSLSKKAEDEVEQLEITS